MSFTAQKIGNSKKSGRGGKLLVLLGLLLALGAIAFGSYHFYYQSLLEKTPGGTEETIVIRIDEGESLTSIAHSLEIEGYIVSSWAFLRYLEKSGQDTKIQSGAFFLPKNLTIPELTERLIDAEESQVVVTLLEGWTNAEIDEKLSELGLITEGEFLECIQTCDFKAFDFLPSNPAHREGYFYPDTYFIDTEQFTVESFAKRLLRTFEGKTAELFAASDRPMEDVLIMASIVEEESRKGNERPIVAGILWKRLDNGWFLGADATTRYITGKKTEALTIEDLEDENEWNTRATKGLPPGAICNPSLSAIKAAVSPEESPYWYYLHDNSGEIHYGTTIEEHNLNKAKYLR